MYIYLCLYFFINNFFLKTTKGRIKIKIFCIFPKFPGNFLENRKKILYKYYLIQKYIIQTIIADKTTKKIFNDVKSKFQIFPISSMLNFLSLHVKL